MPRFAANLSMMFTEVPLLNACRSAKSRVRCCGISVSYNYSTLQIQKQLEQNHLTLALFNTAPGDINAGNGDYPPFPDVSTKHTQTSTWHWNMHWRSIVNKSM